MTLKVKVNQPPKTLGILTQVFCMSGSNLVILAGTSHKLSRGQASDWRPHGQTQATTILEGQNWPRVKTTHPVIPLINWINDQAISHPKISTVSKKHKCLLWVLTQFSYVKLECQIWWKKIPECSYSIASPQWYVLNVFYIYVTNWVDIFILAKCGHSHTLNFSIPRWIDFTSWLYQGNNRHLLRYISLIVL